MVGLEAGDIGRRGEDDAGKGEGRLVVGEGRMLVCLTNSCFRKADESLKSLPQMAQVYGRSPV